MTFRNSAPDWAGRAVLFVTFLFFGAGKFTSNANAPWVSLFNQVGFGQWFRYFTGVIEIMGAFLVLIPQTVTVGLALLACTLTGAILVVVIGLHRPGDAFFALAFLCALIAFWMHRRRVLGKFQIQPDQGKSRPRGVNRPSPSVESPSACGMQCRGAGKLSA